MERNFPRAELDALCLYKVVSIQLAKTQVRPDFQQTRLPVWHQNVVSVWTIFTLKESDAQCTLNGGLP
jgi:hypothetical protein